MVKQNLVKINGVNVNAYRVSSEYIDEYQNRIGEANITLVLAADSIASIRFLSTVQIWEATSGTLEQDSNRVFNGYVSKVERQAGTIKIKAFTKLWRAIQIGVTRVYDETIDDEEGVLSEIFKDLATRAGLNYDSTTIQDSSTAPNGVWGRFVCKKTNIMERMQAIADILGWQYYYRPTTDKIYLEPTGFTINPNVLYVGGTNNNVTEYPNWKEDGTQVFNVVEVSGATQETIHPTESFDGDGTTTDFVLEEIPINTLVKVGGVEKKGGVEGSTSSYDYIINAQQKTISFVSPPGAGTDNVTIQYTWQQPTSIIRRNSAGISSAGYEIYRPFTYTDIQSVDDAERRAQNLLSQYSEPFLSTTIKISPAVAVSYGLAAGQAIRVIDARRNVDDYFIIKKMISKYPESDVILEIGDQEYKVATYENDTTTRLKRLEEELAASGDFVTYSEDLNLTYEYLNRFVMIETNDLAGNDKLIYNHPTYGEWGNFNWGNTIGAGWVVAQLFQYQNIYVEDFLTNTFEDGTGTATWSDTGTCTFTTGQIALSTSIDYNNGTITRAKLTASSTTNLTFYLSADGGDHWETVTSGTTYTFTNTGTDLRWKAVASGNASLTSIRVEGYH